MRERFLNTNLTWGSNHLGLHRCRYCRIELLTGENSGFCCGLKGSRRDDVQPLPPPPPQYMQFINDSRISGLSRTLNLLFSFAALESTHPFPHIAGPPGFVAIQGKIYHRVRPSHRNSAVRWLLYDGFMGNIPHDELARKIPPDWIAALKSALLAYNPLVRGLQTLSVEHSLSPNASLVLRDSGPATELAAIIAYDNTTARQIKPRQLVIRKIEGYTQQIPTVSSLWEPLAYPLLFPHGTLGWGVNEDSNLDETHGQNVPTTQMWYYRARLLREPRFRIFGRLANEYMVDMFTRDLECRLSYIRANQFRIRQEDASLTGIANDEDVSNVYLPSSFIGSKRWASEQIADSLAIAASLGNPTFFITMTCSPDWSEIQNQLLPGQTWTDVPIVVVRVFKRKLALLEQTLEHLFPNLRLVYIIHSVEFQKRGLPHAHIIVKYSAECHTPSDIDSIVSAEIPPDEEDARLVSRFMKHTHPPASQPPSKYCQKEDANGKRTCRFHYPRPLQQYTTIDSEGRVFYRRRKEGDQIIVPYCLELLRLFKCHLNFEVASTAHLFQYLFKYIHKSESGFNQIYISFNSFFSG
jgi:Helitron helicase-like domain at N-terminus